jgi:hypothetical protein
MATSLLDPVGRRQHRSKCTGAQKCSRPASDRVPFRAQKTTNYYNNAKLPALRLCEGHQRACASREFGISESEISITIITLTFSLPAHPCSRSYNLDSILERNLYERISVRRGDDPICEAQGPPAKLRLPISCSRWPSRVEGRALFLPVSTSELRYTPMAHIDVHARGESPKRGCCKVNRLLAFFLLAELVINTWSRRSRWPTVLC